MLDVVFMEETPIGFLPTDVQSRPLEDFFVEVQNEVHRQFAQAKATVRALVGCPTLADVAHTAFGDEDKRSSWRGRSSASTGKAGRG